MPSFRRTTAYNGLRETDLPQERGDRIGTEGFSLDPFAGGTYGDKPIWDLTQISDNLNRTGWNWNTNNPGVISVTDRTINYGFWNTRADFLGTGYINDAQDTAFDEFFNFRAATATAPGGAMSEAQRAAVRATIVLWDDLINVNFVETSVADADIRYGNTDTGGAQAYAYLPFGTVFNDPAGSGGFTNLEDVGGDVWVDYNVASNFNPLRTSYYSYVTLIHETGHALGLSHPGDYDALNDADGDGIPDPITYGNDAFYAQDSAQYTVMSYFDAYETGAQHIDWTLMNFAYGSTPGVHDIAAIQAIYGADPTTRTGDTVYGFNSTANRSVFDFTINTRPIVTIYDAGGNDTLDFSGWNTRSTIDLNAGGFSSGGGTEQFLTLAQINANRAAQGFAPRSQATYDLYNSLFRDPQGLTNGLFHDNIAIAYGVTIENARGGGGDDLIIANNVANRIEGGAGNDTVSYETATRGVIIYLSDNAFGLGGAWGDRLLSIESMIGSDYDDIIVGDGRDNTIDGGAGGRDILYGGRGNDTLSYASSETGVTLNLQNGRTGGGSAGDIYYEFENIRGSAFDDTLDGDSGANKIWGGAGGDRIQGNSGNDDLYGEAGNDTIFGGSGDDRITGGAGADRMDGGSGNDTFIFTAIDSAIDVIVDFTRGRDRIDLSAIDAITGTTANDAFSFIGSSAFSNIAGQVRFAGDFVYGDVNGDGVADFTIQLTGVTVLGAADFVL
jgi:hypothetical protein